MKKCLALITAACILACLLSGCFLLPEEAAPPELPLVTAYSGTEYASATVLRGDLEQYANVSLTYYPTRREDVKFDVADRSYGVIYVSVGDEVKEGDLLAELDATSETAAMEQTEEQLERLRIQLEAAQTELWLAWEEERLKGNASHVASEARQADITYYEACIEIQESRLADQQAELEKLRLYAPIDGTVTYVKAVDEKSRSGKNDTVVTISDSTSSVFTAVTDAYQHFPAGSEFCVTTSAAEYDCIARNPADFGLNAETDRNGRRTVVLEIAPGQQAPSGSSVRGEVSLLLQKRENVLMLPSHAVFTVGERSYVYREDETGFKTAWEVNTGLDNGSMVEITDGLGEGEQIIVG